MFLLSCFRQVSTSRFGSAHVCGAGLRRTGVELHGAGRQKSSMSPQKKRTHVIFRCPFDTALFN